MAHSYTKKTWKNFPDETTPILAEELNRIESGIEESIDSINDTEKFVGYKITQSLKFDTQYSVPNFENKEVTNLVGKNLNESITNSTEAISIAMLELKDEFESSENFNSVYTYITHESDIEVYTNDRIININKNSLYPSETEGLIGGEDGEIILLYVSENIICPEGGNIELNYTDDTSRTYTIYMFDLDSNEISNLYEGLYAFFFNSGDLYMLYNHSNFYSKTKINEIINTVDKNLKNFVGYSANGQTLNTDYKYPDLINATIWGETGKNINECITESTRLISSSIIENVNVFYAENAHIENSGLINFELIYPNPNRLVDKNNNEGTLLILNTEIGVMSEEENEIFFYFGEKKYKIYKYSRSGYKGVTSIKKGIVVFALYPGQGAVNSAYIFFEAPADVFDINTKFDELESEVSEIATKAKKSKLMLYKGNYDFGVQVNSIISEHPPTAHNFVITLDSTNLHSLKPSSTSGQYAYDIVLGGEEGQYTSEIFFKIYFGSTSHHNESTIYSVHMDYSTGGCIGGGYKEETFINQKVLAAENFGFFSIFIYIDTETEKIQFMIQTSGVGESTTSITESMFLEEIWIVSNNPKIQALYDA